MHEFKYSTPAICRIWEEEHISEKNKVLRVHIKEYLDGKLEVEQNTPLVAYRTYTNYEVLK